MRCLPTSNIYIHSTEGQRTGRKTQFLEGPPPPPGVGSILPQKRSILNRSWNPTEYQYDAPVRITAYEDIVPESDEESSEFVVFIKSRTLPTEDNVH
jgi:hypothetical protein